MRLATYNIEWFDALFDDAGRLLWDNDWSARHNITRGQQLDAIALVLTHLDADAIMVIEAPDTSRKRATEPALERFADWAGLRARRALIGFPNDTQQEIALIYDPDVLSAVHDPRGQTHHDQSGAAAPRFDTTLHIDLDIDATQDHVSFSKPPLEVALTPAGGGPELRLIGAHLKSKAPHGARSRDAIMRLAIANRRKQLAQAIWLRRRVDEHLTEGEPVIVLGDLNDGPGLDEYEDLFGRSSVEIVLGQGAQALYDPHAARALQRRLSVQPTTARFYIKPEKRYLQALLDYIMVSPDLRGAARGWRIWHPFDDPDCWTNPDLRDALLTASDHFPVTLDFDRAAFPQAPGDPI